MHAPVTAGVALHELGNSETFENLYLRIPKFHPYPNLLGSSRQLILYIKQPERRWHKDIKTV